MIRRLVAATAGILTGLLTRRCWDHYLADPDPQEVCTCPDLDVSTYRDDPDNPPTIKGHDPRCPTHGEP